MTRTSRHALAEPLAQDRQANSGGNRDHEQVGTEFTFELGRHADHLLGLYGQEQHIGAAGNLGVVVHGLTGGRTGESLAGLGQGV